MLSAYNVVFAALLIPAGLAGDLVGRRRLFLGGVVGFIAASALCAVAPSLGVLVGARVLQAAAAAALVPSSLGLLLPEFPPERRASATALWGATGAVAAATGPTLGGLLVEYASWRWVFLVNLPIGVAAVVAGRRVLVERRDPAKALVPDLAGIALLIVGVGALVAAVTQGDASAWGWADARTLAAFAVAAGSVLAFVLRSRDRANAVVDLGLFRARSFSAAVAGSFVFALGFYALLLSNVSFLTGVWHYSVLRTGLALSPSPLLAAVSSPLAGRLVDRIGPRAVALTGTVLFAAGVAGFAWRVQATPDWVGRWLPASIVCGIGIGMTFAALGAAAVATLPPARLGAGGALSQTARQVGAGLGIAGFVAILGTPSAQTALAAFHRCWWAIVVTALLAALTAPLLPYRSWRAGPVVASPVAVPA